MVKSIIEEIEQDLMKKELGELDLYTEDFKEGREENNDDVMFIKNYNKA